MQKRHTLIFFYFIFCSCGYFSSSTSSHGSSNVDKFPELASVNSQIEKSPKNASLLYQRGMILSKLKQDSLAILDFQNAIKIDSNKADYYSAIGNILFEHKDIAGSAVWLAKAVALNPSDEMAHLKMAKLFLYTGEYPKAFTEINTVLRGNVYNPEAYFLKGMCYKNMKDSNKAISSFQTAVQTDPKYADAYMQLALIYQAKKDPVSLRYFENAYQADTSNLESLYGAAMYWQDQEKFAEAKKVFTRIVYIDRQYPKAFFNMGWMLLQEDSTEKAIRQFDIAIQVKPDYAEAYYNRGLCYEIRNEKTQAIADYKQALIFSPDFALCKTALQRVQMQNPKL